MVWWAVPAVLAVLLTALLLLPARLSLFATSDPPAARVRLRVLGRVGPSVTLFDAARRQQPAKHEIRRDSQSGRRQPMTGRRVDLGAALTAGADALRAVRIERLRLRARFGLDDPAETGTVFGLLCPLIYAGPADLELEPDFTGLVFDGEGEVVLAVPPIRLLLPGWRLVRALRGEGA